MKKEAFISKWFNWWMFNNKRKELDDAFQNELNELIESEVKLRLNIISGTLSK